LAIAADSFHTKPLRQYLQSTDRYHVLGLTRHEVRLFEGNRHSLVEIELTAEVAQNMIDALGDELTEKHSLLNLMAVQEQTASVCTTVWR